MSEQEGSGAEPPRRVTVTSPRTRASRNTSGHPVARDIDEQTALGEVYLRSLMRAQLRLAATACAVFGVLIGGLPLLFVLLPRLKMLQVFGLPLPWLLLGILIYPLLVGGGWYFVRQAERNERTFARLVERS